MRYLSGERPCHSCLAANNRRIEILARILEQGWNLDEHGFAVIVGRRLLVPQQFGALHESRLEACFLGGARLRVEESALCAGGKGRLVLRVLEDSVLGHRLPPLSVGLLARRDDVGLLRPPLVGR